MEALRVLLGTFATADAEEGDSFFFRKLQFGMEWAPRSPMVREQAERVLSAKDRLPHRAVLHEAGKNIDRDVQDDPRNTRALTLLAAARASVALLSSAMHVQALPALRGVADDLAAVVKKYSIIEVVRKERLLRLWADPTLTASGTAGGLGWAAGTREKFADRGSGRQLDSATAALLASTLEHACEAERVGVSLGLSLLEDCLALVAWLDMPTLLYRRSERWRESLDVVLAILNALSEHCTLLLPRELIARELEFLLPSSSLSSESDSHVLGDTDLGSGAELDVSTHVHGTEVDAESSVIQRLAASITQPFTSDATTTEAEGAAQFLDDVSVAGADVRRAMLLYRLLPCLPFSYARGAAQAQLRDALQTSMTTTTSPLLSAALQVVLTGSLRPDPSGMGPIKEAVWHTIRTPVPSAYVSAPAPAPECAPIRALYAAQAAAVDHEVASSRTATDRLCQLCVGPAGPALLLGREQRVRKRRIEQGVEEREMGPRGWYGAGQSHPNPDGTLQAPPSDLAVDNS